MKKRSASIFSSKGAIAQAKENLARGNLIPTRDDYHGAARLPEKTPEEVAAERNAQKITA